MGDRACTIAVVWLSRHLVEETCCGGVDKLQWDRLCLASVVDEIAMDLNVRNSLPTAAHCECRRRLVVVSKVGVPSGYISNWYLQELLLKLVQAVLQ
jgi:hypothetical protein